MKTIFSLLLPTGFAALVALPISLEILASLFFSAGFLFVMRADYSRRLKVLTTSNATVRGTSESLRLAA